MREREQCSHCDRQSTRETEVPSLGPSGGNHVPGRVEGEDPFFHYHVGGRVEYNQYTFAVLEKGVGIPQESVARVHAFREHQCKLT